LAGKGAIALGMDADLVLWDTARQVTYGANDLADNVGYNPWEGTTVTGWPDTVVLRGSVMVEAGKFIAPAPAGRWLHRRGGEARPFGKAAAEVDYLVQKGAI
jgi:dihydropyrimidinase